MESMGFSANSILQEDLIKGEELTYKHLIRNKPYLYITLANTVNFFTVSGVQYWATYYYINALGTPQHLANICFGALAITAPLIGAILSGFIANKLGGYGSTKIIPFLIGISLLAAPTALYLPEADSWQLLSLLFFVLLLLGGIQIPICYGVILNKVEPELRPMANSFSYMVYNLLGYFPAPILYGIANSSNGADKLSSRYGMKLLMYAQLLVTLFYYLA